jgi:hypothetical protein
MKFVAAILAAALLGLFIGPVVVKLNDAALWVVAGIGFTMMLIDLVQSLRTKDE